MNIDLWFPSAISRSQCPFIHEIQEPYKKIIADYKYNNSGFCGERIHENDKFKRLNDWVQKEVEEYTETHKYKGQYFCNESWLLDYPVGGAQFFHAHPGFVISGVFFLEGHENDTAIRFKNPVVDMKNPLGKTAHNELINDTVFNELTYTEIAYPPKSGQLLLWRSYLQHGCHTKILKCKRIVFSYNFDASVTLKTA